jgi:hypothetical protein
MRDLSRVFRIELVRADVETEDHVGLFLKRVGFWR